MGEVGFRVQVRVLWGGATVIEHHVLYECGICECLHRWEWNGDCRDDGNRFVDEDDFRQRRCFSMNDSVEVRSAEERLVADVCPKGDPDCVSDEDGNHDECTEFQV